MKCSAKHRINKKKEKENDDFFFALCRSASGASPFLVAFFLCVCSLFKADGDVRKDGVWFGVTRVRDMYVA